MRGGLLILAYEFPPENVVGALRPFRFAKYLPTYGVATHVITASIQPSNNDLINIHYVEDRTRDHSVEWMKVVRRAQAILLQLLGLGPGNMSLSWIPSAKAAAERLISEAPISCVLSTFPPLATHLTASWLKKRNKDLKWIADFRDPLTDNPGSSQWENFWNRTIERRIFRQADYLIANTDAAAERWRTMYPQWKHKITEIWNGFDPEEKIVPPSIPRREYKVLAHVGEIYAGRHPHILLDSLARLVRSGRIDPSSFQLHFIGDIDFSSFPERELLQSLVRAGCVKLAPAKSSPEDAARAMAESDYLLLIDWTDVRSGLQVPAKLYVYIRVGRPILAITKKESPVDRILTRSGAAHCCLYPDDSEAQRDAKVLDFLTLPSERRTPSDWFLQEFDGERQVSSLAAILNTWRFV